MRNNKDAGRTGEGLAAAALQKNGYTILTRNYRKKCGEIDIIAQKNDVVYFVEVKARSNTRYAAPADAVNAAKRRHIADTASVWLAKNGERMTSFLVAEVDLTDNSTDNSVQFIEDFLR